MRVLVVLYAAMLLMAPLAAAQVAAVSDRETDAGNPIGLACYTANQCWGAEALQFRGQNGSHFDFVCPSYGSAYAKIFDVYGTDVYTDDSSVCLAAVHTGKITLTGGGVVTIEIRPGQDSYRASTRNGITSRSFISWPGSFVVIGATAGNPPATGVGLYGWRAGATDFRAFAGSRFAYICPAGGTAGGVWGTDVYADESSVCTAAVHAGRITVGQGGRVTIEMRPGQNSYRGSTRNGITSFNLGAAPASFVVLGASRPVAEPTGSATGTVVVNGAPFTSGTIPYGSIVDVTHGRLTLRTDVGTLAVYGDGTDAAIFRLTRASARLRGQKRPLVQLTLIGADFSVCGTRTRAPAGPRSSGADAKRKRRIVRALWGDGKGRFRTQGRYASATVRGTIWLTADRCDGTFVQVKQGTVTVRDLTRRRTVRVPAGRSYLAPAHR